MLNCGDLIHMMKMDFQCMSFYRKLNMDVRAHTVGVHLKNSVSEGDLCSSGRECRSI